MKISSNQIQVQIRTSDAVLLCDAEGKFRWLVDISIADTVVARNVEVSDPLTSEEQVNNRWYLERFLQQNPYEEIESQEALRLLSVYGASILEQLGLRSLVETQINQDTNTEVGWELSIEVFDSEASPTTIHQLFWELLEDPQLFHAEVQTVTVFRSLEGAKVQPIPAFTFKQQDSTINILLVVARDTNRNAALYDDISPFLATDILLDIKRDLERKHRRVHMNVEIVRPGTLKAFEDHLAASERRHGPGYFHVVHFDLHGKIGARSGALEKKKYAFLYFSHPSDERTKPERVQKVAAILQQYRVPFVVLNACESARAGLEDDANIAKVFCKGNVRNVVAMSFKISSSAASMFLHEFYARLLVTGCSFSVSASRARALLRSSPERSARFGLQNPLMDWFVPVVYGSVTGSAIQEDCPTEPKQSDPLIGRNFDILRFERLLIQQNLLYLHGPRGSGKTRFVQYVASLWQETSRVEAILYLDMAEERIESLTDLIRILIRKLSENLIRTGSHSVVNTHILDVWLSDKAGLAGVFLDILRKVPTFLIFDNLHVSHSDNLKGAMSKSAKAIFNELVTTLLNYVSTCARDRPVYVALVSCRSFKWAQEKLGCNFSSGVYELSGLQLADAIEMVQATRGKSNAAGKAAMCHDMDSLELIVSLFQGLPGALKLLEGVGTPLDMLYGNLRSLPHLCEATDIPSGPYFQEISDVVAHLPDYYQPLISLLGAFWYEGDSAYLIISLFPSFAPRIHGSYVPLPHEFNSTSVRVLETLQDLGYLDSPLGRDKPTSIHPMLSIYTRLTHTNGHSHSSPPATVELKTDPFGNVSSLVLGLQWYNIFMISVVKSMQDRWDIPIEQGKRSDHLYELAARNFPNILNCLDICIRGKDDLPLDCWPLSTFKRMAGIMNDAASVVEFKLFAQKLETLLDAFFESLGSLEVPIEYQSFASFAYIFLVSTNARQGMSYREVTKKLVDRGLEMFKATERKYGLKTSRGILYGSGCLYFLDTYLNMELGMPQKARSSWQQARELMGRAADDEADETSTRKSDNEVIGVDRFLGGLLREVLDLGTTQTRADELLTLELARVMHKNMSILTGHMEDLISGMERKTQPSHSNGMITGPDREMLQVLNEMSAHMDGVYERQGLSRQTPRFIQNMLVTNAENRFGKTNMSSRLERMETSADIGDWTDVGEQHLFFITAGLISLDIEQMRAHVDAALDIYSRSPRLSRQLQEMEKFKEFMTKRLPDSNIFTPTNRQQTGLRNTDDMAWDWLLKTLNEMGSESKDAAKLHEQVLRLREEGIMSLGMDKETHEKLGQGFLKSRTIGLEGMMKRFLEFLDLRQQITSAIEARDWEKCLTLNDFMLKNVAELFGGESNFSTVWQDFRKTHTWLQVALPLFAQFDEAIKACDFALASSMFASLTEVTKEYSQLDVADEIIKDMRKRMQALKLLNWTSTLDENQLSTIPGLSKPSDDSKKELRGMLDELCGLYEADQAVEISSYFKAAFGEYFREREEGPSSDSCSTLPSES